MRDGRRRAVAGQRDSAARIVTFQNYLPERKQETDRERERERDRERERHSEFVSVFLTFELIRGCGEIYLEET